HREAEADVHAIDHGEAEEPGHQIDGWRRLADDERDAVQAADRMLRRESLRDPRLPGVASGGDQLEGEPGSIGEADHRLLRSPARRGGAADRARRWREPRGAAARSPESRSEPRMT